MESILVGIDEVENLEELIQKHTPKPFRVIMPTSDNIFTEDEDTIDVACSRANKTKDGDINKFKSFIKELSSNSGFIPDTQNFKKEEIMKIIEHVFKGYFEKYELFNYTITYEQAEDDVFLKATIDTPQFVPVLEDAHFQGKIVQESEKLQHEEEIRLARSQKEQLEESIKLEEEARRMAEYERWAGLDEKTIQVIEDRLAETREFMEKEI